MKKYSTIVAGVCLALMSMSGFAFGGACAGDSAILQRLQVQSILDDVALIHSIDPELLSAMARVESNECVDAISPKGAVGLMQLMPATASGFGVQNRFDPVQNALGAARFIDYLKRNRLTLPEIIAAYNAGEGAVARAGGVPHYRETEEYVRRVLWLYLIGHVPKMEMARGASTSSKPQTRTVAAKAPHRFGGSDSAILAQLAGVRRARRQSLTSAAAAE
ncbi:MAG TPA: lytic transglycosylase domain-containing protein [Candidatus Binataceae bacterium]|nr:lytic transglycosylase domain-containing protein [Candidatus Binataceae bacterium]